MKKRLLALTMAMVMVAGSMVACGKETTTPETTPDGGDTTVTTTPDDGEGTTTPEVTPEPDTADVVDAAVMEAPDPTGWDDSMKIYAFTWDGDLAKKMQVFYDKNPELADYVIIEQLTVDGGGTGDAYKTAVDNALDGMGDKYPSIIAADNGVAKYWSETDATANLYDIGLTDEMYANAYNFSKQYANFNGELKCMTWQATPGSVVYRKDIAEEVFGVSEPEDVQELLKDWDSFMEAAAQLKEAGYQITSGYDEVKYAIWDTQDQPLVQTIDGVETITLDASVTEYLETAKKLADEGYASKEADYGMWQSSWAAEKKAEGKVFCYFGCPWYIGSEFGDGSVLAGNTDTTDWGAVVGPTSYHWGGTYLMVGADCPNPELAAYVLYEVCCNAENMYDITKNTGDFVNNKEANANLVADGVGANKILDGQNPIAVWADAALNIDLSNATYADSSIRDNYIDAAAKAYVNGELSLDEAIEQIKDGAATGLGLAK